MVCWSKNTILLCQQDKQQVCNMRVFCMRWQSLTGELIFFVCSWWLSGSDPLWDLLPLSMGWIVGEDWKCICCLSAESFQNYKWSLVDRWFIRHKSQGWHPSNWSRWILQGALSGVLWRKCSTRSKWWIMGMLCLMKTRKTCYLLYRRGQHPELVCHPLYELGNV